MTAPASPEATAPATPEQTTPIESTAPVQPAPVEPEPAPEAGENIDELPEWARKKLDKVNREAQNLRTRLKDQEPLVTAAQEAERAKMTELDRERAEKADIATQLAQREGQLLASICGEENVDLLGEGTFEEKSARAQRIAAMRQPQPQSPAEPTAPPTQRPVESLRPGASPTPPPAVDNSYPASWGFQPPTQ